MRPTRPAYAGPTVYHVASGVRNPFRYGRLVELVQAWFTEHPLYDSDGQPIVVPGLVVPRTRPGAAPADPGLHGHGPGREGGRLAAHPGPPGRMDGRPGGAAPPGRPGPGLRRAVRRLHRDRGSLPGGPAPRPVGPHGRRRPPGLLPRPGRHRLGALRPGHPPALGHRARPGAHDAGQVDQAQPGRPGQQGHPLPRSPPGRLRPREHPDRLQRGRLLRLAGLPPPGPGRAGRSSWPTWWPRPPPSCSSTAGTGATSCGPSTVGTRAPRSTGSGTTGGSSSTTSSWPSRSPTGSPGSASTGPSATGPSSSPAPWTWWSSRSARCSTPSSAPASGEADGSLHRPARRAAPHRRGPGPGAGRVRRGRGPPAGGVHGLRRLGQRPAHAGGGGLPGGGQPRGQAGRHRPPAGLARRALAQGRRGLANPCCPSARSTAGARSDAGRTSAAALAGGRPSAAGVRIGTSRGGPVDEGAGLRTEPARASPLPGWPPCSARGGGGHRPPPARWTAGAPELPGDGLVPPHARCSRASAAPTWPRWTAGARATSRTWSASRSSPATRWSASSSTGGTDHAGRQLAPGHPGGDRAGARLCPPAHPPGLPLLRRRASTGLCGNVAFGALEPGPADRLLRRHRRRMVDRAPVRPRLPAPRRARVVLRRGRRDGRAHRLRRPRRAVGRGGRRRRGGRGRAPEPWVWHASPRCTTWSAPAPTARSRSGPSTPTSGAGPRPWAPTPWSRPISWPGPSGAGRDRWSWPDV